MFRDFGAKNGTHLGIFCQKSTHLGGTSPYSVSMGVPPPRYTIQLLQSVA